MWIQPIVFVQMQCFVYTPSFIICVVLRYNCDVSYGEFIMYETLCIMVWIPFSVVARSRQESLHSTLVSCWFSYRQLFPCTFFFFFFFFRWPKIWCDICCECDIRWCCRRCTGTGGLVVFWAVSICILETRIDISKHMINETVFFHLWCVPLLSPRERVYSCTSITHSSTFYDT